MWCIRVGINDESDPGVESDPRGGASRICRSGRESDPRAGESDPRAGESDLQAGSAGSYYVEQGQGSESGQGGEGNVPISRKSVNMHS